MSEQKFRTAAKKPTDVKPKKEAPGEKKKRQRFRVLAKAIPETNHFGGFGLGSVRMRRVVVPEARSGSVPGRLPLRLACR